MQYQIMFYGGMAGAIITLSISIFVFLKYNILQVIEDLTGFQFFKRKRTSSSDYPQDKKTESSRSTTEIKLKKNFFENWNGLAREVDRINHAGKLIPSTELKYKDQDPTVLLDEETTILKEMQDETTLISESGDETTLLPEMMDESYVEPFKKQVDIMVVHSDVILTD